MLTPLQPSPNNLNLAQAHHKEHNKEHHKFQCITLAARSIGETHWKLKVCDSAQVLQQVLVHGKE